MARAITDLEVFAALAQGGYICLTEKKCSVFGCNYDVEGGQYQYAGHISLRRFEQLVEAKVICKGAENKFVLNRAERLIERSFDRLTDLEAFCVLVSGGNIISSRDGWRGRSSFGVYASNKVGYITPGQFERFYKAGLLRDEDDDYPMEALYMGYGKRGDCTLYLLVRPDEKRRRQEAQEKWWAMRQKEVRVQKERLILRLRRHQEVSPLNIVCLDCETTGLSSEDEILQLSIVNGAGEVLFNEYIRPQKISA